MSITPKSPGNISAPNTLTSENVGAISIPNNLASEAANSIGIPNVIPAMANPLDDWDDLPISHSRIGYGNLLTGADTSDLEKALTPNTYERASTGSGAQTLDFQLTTSANIDYVGIAAHNLSGETVTIQYATVIGGPYTDIVTVAFTDNEAYMYLLPSALSVAEIRLSATFSEIKEIGVVQVGIALQMYQPLYGGHSPIDLSANTSYQSTNSDTGQFIGRTIIREGLETGYSYRFLDADWVRERFKPFMKHARSLPFFIKWRPDLFETSAYGYTTSDIKPVNMGGGHQLMSVNFNVRAHQDI